MSPHQFFYCKLTILFFGSLLLFSVKTAAQPPTADFTSNVTTGCAPLTVQFTDQSTGNPFSYNWDFGNGQLSNIKNPSVTYSQPGTYTVRLVVRNSSGLDGETKVNYITVAPSAAASLGANITTACAPATIQFRDQSTISPGGGTITEWFWTFGDGNTSTLQHPTHTYTATGFYTVSLRITTSTGCQSTTSAGRYIRIVDGITANFTNSFPTTCTAPFIVNFTDQSSGPGNLTYNWTFGNGGPGSTLQNPSAVYATAGTFPVTLSVQSDLGCSGTITKNITIAGKTTSFTAPSSICVGQSVTFQNTSSPSPVSSTWDFGDGTNSSQINPIKTFLAPGTYSVKLVNNYGNCRDSITQNVTVISNPPINFRANDSTSCQAPFTVNFTDLSPAATTWLWDFGDGGSSTQQNPSHTYTSPGLYTVTLTITLPGGCTNTLVKSQYIQIQPALITFTNIPNGGCLPFTISPVANIQSLDPVVSYQWDMGEPGGIYNTQFPTHTYTTLGDFTVRLTITTASGCTQTITVPNGIRTGPKPIADFEFNPNTVCASAEVNFIDRSTTTPGAFLEYLWEFGDGASSTAQNPTHVYVDTGQLTVRFIVSNNGCKDTLEKPIMVLPPVAIFGYELDCNNRLTVRFADTSLTNPIYGPITYEWRMGDPANTIFFGLPAPVFTYPAIGTYQATLIVTNGPCTYEVTKPVIIADEPATFSIDKNPVCKGEVFTLTATGSNPANIKDYTWTIGGNVIPDTSRSITYSLGAYGTYDVTLLVEDVNGCTSTQTIPGFITVSGPIAAFTPNSLGACVNGSVSFTDQSTPAGTITEWKWNFGDGSQQTFSAPPFSHTYTETGSYTITLMIKSGPVCADTVSIPNAVLITRPQAAFRADTFYCPVSPLQFIDTSSGSGLTYNWDFGDGGTSTLQNPVHSYPAGNNEYTVKLKIRDVVGCEDSVTKTNYIKIRSPKSAFTMTDSTAICLPLNTSFLFQGTDYSSFLWDFGDGTTSTADNPAHFYNTYGTFTPKLYVYGNGGCVDSSQGTVITYNPATSTQITFDPATACNSLTTQFNIVTPPGFPFKFHFGDGGIDSSMTTSFSHFYSTPGKYFPRVIMKDRFGCEAGVSSPIPVEVFGSIPLFDKDKKEFCDFGEVFFVNYTLNNDPIISTVWDFGDGNSSTATDPSHIYNTPGTYLVTLTVTTQNLCVNSYTDTIRVYKTPELSIIARDTICVNTSEMFQGVLSMPDSTIQWNWNLGNGNSSQVANPSATYVSPGNFTIQLIAKNKLNCADTATHDLHVVALPTATPLTDPYTILSGGSVQLNMTYTGQISSYNWVPATNLDCSNCPSPTANPQFTTRYQVNVTDRFGCSNSAFVTVKVICTGQNFFVPNTFSPNGDGSNDVFYLRGTGLFRVKSFRVFNRWGELVFEKREIPVNDPNSGWNGMFRGKKAQADVYVYQLEIICSNGEIMNYSGNVALIL